jgi:hypothetical protein
MPSNEMDNKTSSLQITNIARPLIWRSGVGLRGKEQHEAAAQNPPVCLWWGKKLTQHNVPHSAKYESRV